MSKGQHLPGYKRPKTGQPRRTRQPFYINTLPAKTREGIRALRAEGKTWEQIEELSPTFSPKRLSASTLQRWFDVNIEQPAGTARVARPSSTPPSPGAGGTEELIERIAQRVKELLKPLLPGRAA